MVNKIKVKVKADKANINLPAVPISWLPFFLNIAMKVKSKSSENQDNGKVVDVNVDVMLHQIGDLIKQAKPLLKELDPFTMVEVESDDAYVLIEMR